MDSTEKLRASLASAAENRTIKKLILSRPKDKNIKRTEGRIFEKKNEIFLQLETFLSDGKALHTNLSLETAAEEILLMLGDYRQLNIITTNGDMEARISSKGKLLISGKLGDGESVAPASHDRNKQTILHEGEIYRFLVELGVTDKLGRVFDKKRAKFRQIDRFLHYINEIYRHLRSSEELYILDLCCGKSYLTFAAYWYLTVIKGRNVKMLGADRKEDVIKYCSDISEKLGYDGLSFVCCDINELIPERRPDLVLSLHACDIATDIVLTTAARLGADVILSTPCCQHQINSQLSVRSKLGAELSAVLQHSLIKQKLAVALTDALRCKRLEASGYNVDVTELIDPENTPKNLMIRAVRTQINPERKAKLRDEFNALCEFAEVEIYGGDGFSARSDGYIIYKEEKNQ